MMIYSPYWNDIEPYIYVDEHGYQCLANNASKEIREKFWKYQADSADGLGIKWVKENIPPEYHYIIENRQKFNW